MIKINLVMKKKKERPKMTRLRRKNMCQKLSTILRRMTLSSKMKMRKTSKWRAQMLTKKNKMSKMKNQKINRMRVQWLSNIKILKQPHQNLRLQRFMLPNNKTNQSKMERLQLLKKVFMLHH